MELSRKELFKYLGTLGLALLVVTYLWYSTTEVMGKLKASLLIAGGVLVLAYLVVNAGDIVASFQKRSTRLGANSAVVLLGAFAIFGFVNFLGYRHHKKFDLTAEKLYSLSDQTIKTVSGLQKDVKIYYLSLGKTDEPVADLVEQYRYYSKHITYERVDLQARPELAGQFRGARPTETIVSAGNRTEKLPTVDEQSLTSALLKVTRDQAKTVCFVEGHGERESQGQGPEGYNTVNNLLKNDNYNTKSVNLTTANASLTDCSVVVLAGPKKPLLQPETDALSKFLSEGGKMMIAVDPDADPEISSFLKEWNIELRKDIVVEPTVRLPNASPAIVVVRDFGSHPINKNFGPNLPVILPLAQSLKTDSAKGDVTVTELLKTSASGYGKTDLKATDISPVEGSDNKGPLSLAVAATKKVNQKEARLIVIGDSDFATNSYQRLFANGDWFVNSINWLAEEEDLISIRPKSPTDRKVDLSATADKILFWLTLILPLAVIGAGIQIWWKRR